MLVPVGVLAVLAVVGGWIQFAPFWHPVDDWLAARSRDARVAEPTNWQEALSSGPRGRARPRRDRRRVGDVRRRKLAVPRFALVQRALEHKLYFDEAYDAVFYRPAVALASVAAPRVEEPVIAAASARPRRDTRRRRPASCRGCRPGCCARTSSCSHRASPSSPSSSSWCDDRLLTTLLICLPIGAALADLGAAALALSRPARSRCSSRCSRSASGSSSSARFDFDAGRPAVRAAAAVVQRPARLVPRRRVRLLALARRAHRRRDGGRDRLRLLGGTRTAARVLRADALPHGRDRRRLRRAGPAALLRVLRGDADPALRARRRLGRPGPARRDGEVRASTRWPARC